VIQCVWRTGVINIYLRAGAAATKSHYGPKINGPGVESTHSHIRTLYAYTKTHARSHLGLAHSYVRLLLRKESTITDGWSEKKNYDVRVHFCTAGVHRDRVRISSYSVRTCLAGHCSV
jgi:hypothetical protein